MNKGKVGIATLYGGANYGNALQNYAVQTLIEQAGYEAITLKNTTKKGFPDFAKTEPSLAEKLHPVYIKEYLRVRTNSRYGSKNDRDFILGVIPRPEKDSEAYAKATTSRMKRFNEFRERMIHDDDVETSNVRYDKEHMSEFDAFVCGSDQVWNPYYHQVSMIDFLQFAPEYKRIALAPSFGVSEIPESRIADYSKWLTEIPHLSVREDAGAKIIKELTGREARVLMDPTFGLTKEQWVEFAREPEVHPERKFVFCYFLGNETKEYVRWIERYADKHNCDIVDVCDIHDMRYYDTDPQEFVWLLMNARVVFTDSFHGVAFSINMQKPFVAFKRTDGATMSSRITTVLKKTGMSNRQNTQLKLEDVDAIDFSRSEVIIETERIAIHTYLREALEEVCKFNNQPSVRNIRQQLAHSTHCTGCAACMNACDNNALVMKADSEGFLYPEIDDIICTVCGKCSRACPSDIQSYATSGKNPKATYGYSKDLETCANSSSGGIFTELAKKIIEQGGIIYGVGYDEDFNVVHKSVDSVEKLIELRTSKYVQSDAGIIYQEAKRKLEDGRKVLFSGTTCQIAGLKAYLDCDYDNLITQDIICHGVPSPLAWRTYLKQYHADRNIDSISFRDKTEGWNSFSMKVSCNDGSSYRVKAVEDPFERAFLANLNLRYCCYQCQYKTVSRCSDITLADYWGVELVHPEINEQQGVSLVLLQSDKGKILFDSIKDRIHWGETDLNKAISMNSGATRSVTWPNGRSTYFERIKTEQMGEVVEDLLKPTTEEAIKRFVIRNGSRAKRILRKIKGSSK